MKRTSLVAGDDPLSMLLSTPTQPATAAPSGASTVAPPVAATIAATVAPTPTTTAATVANDVAVAAISTAPAPTTRRATVQEPVHPIMNHTPTFAIPAANGASASLSPPRPSLASDPDDIIVDSQRQREIATRQGRKEHQPLYVGTGIAGTSNAAAIASGSAPPLPARRAATSLPAASSSDTNAAESSSSTTSPATVVNPSALAARRASAFNFKPSSLPQRHRDWNPSAELTSECTDDWNTHGKIPGEKPVMQIPDVVSYNAHDDSGSVLHSLYGTLFMTSYQLFLLPTQRRDRLGQSVQAIPLSTIDRIEIEKAKGGASSSGSPLGPHHLLNYLDIYSKDGRFLKFGFHKFDECKKAYDCLNQYVFPAKEEYLFAFYYKIKQAIPAHLDGWNLYDPIEECKRQGINTIPLQPPNSTQSDELRLSWANENYTLCSSYPRVLVVPSEKFVTDMDLHVVAQFRSRGRIPVCTWKHPVGRQTIWRCSQPKVGMNNARCAEDERLLNSLTNFGVHGDQFAIYDARPRFNARANILAGKGFENPELYRNAVKKIHFMDIQNIHVMRDSYNKLIKACQKENHDFNFLTNVNGSGWLNHIACCLKATLEMVKGIDQDKLSILVHCSDGWDRTAQLAALSEICLDPFYRTSKGFMILVEKEWLSMGHQFQRRTGHKDKNYTDDQRSCIFLQFCDCVFQLLNQFPTHFEFNSHFLVTIMHHLYSCRFGTFFANNDMTRRKNKIREKTVSLWTYMMCSPAAIAGEFNNPLYSKNGNGSEEAASATMIAAGGGQPLPPVIPTNPDEVGFSSLGRGGGDGSRFGIGTVLYPSYSLKRVTLWTDYFLRWSNEQVEQIAMGPNAGSVPPGGATTTRLVSNDSLLQSTLRRQARDTRLLETYAQAQVNRVRELEAELSQLKIKHGIVDAEPDLASLSPAAASSSASPEAEATAATDGEKKDETKAASASSEDGASGSSVPASAAVVPAADIDASAGAIAEESSEEAAEPAVDPESAALEEALRKRLYKEVDFEKVNVKDEVEPEDPTTL